MIEQTRDVMSKLRFLGMLETLDLRLHEAQSTGWSYSDFIRALVTDEKLFRDDRAIKSRVRAAKFRVDASLEKLDLTAKRSLTKTLVNELKRLKFLTDPRNVLIMGATGVGKTFLATAIGDHACKEGFKTLFLGMNMFIEESSMRRAAGTFLK